MAAPTRAPAAAPSQATPATSGLVSRTAPATRTSVRDQARRSHRRTEVRKVWKSILKQASVRDVRVHDARHTAATLLIEQGVNIRVGQRVLGHTRVATTERYTHVSTPLMRDAGQRLAPALWGHPQ
ncbi:hypothetical protein E1286_22825 [Nonomuraea terrae]|uniref:Tyr recombinase domain-containing protein n=1 Tax=Nonomuraea terrae TaxID=2530383 RepID=A0A4R4YLD9_9ACTN|nr:hypothetical protein E1286_22825 [Nonomuraea terrae]